MDPHAVQTVTPYIQEELGEADLTIDRVLTLAPERTLLEKALILHCRHCGHRDQGRLPDDRHRLSRHYYDVGMDGTDCYHRSRIGKLSPAKSCPRPYSGIFPPGLEEAHPGSFHLIPQDALATFLTRDYGAMQGMILGESPPFEDILQAIADLEARLNTLSD